jgi:lauroyl/myristoyl acyltransferase
MIRSAGVPEAGPFRPVPTGELWVAPGSGEVSIEPDRIVAGMFQGPPRLGWVAGVVRRLPPPVAECVLASLAVGEGVVRGARFRRASAWAAAQGASGWARRRLALALLANHGRFVAAEMMVGVGSLEDLRRDVVVEGAGHLHQTGGAILLGFHLGPPRTWLTLRALGHPVRFAGRLETANQDPQWNRALEAGDVVRLPAGRGSDRLESLYRIRNFLREGALVYLTADGPFGREAFRLDLPGGPLVVRVGWLALRRHTGAPTFPVLVRREGRRRVIVVHPPLPEPDADPARDAENCRTALLPLVEAYVRRFPSQCRYLALPRWPTSEKI